MTRTFALPSASLLILLIATSLIRAEAPEKLPLYPGDAPVGDGTTDPAKPTITVYRPPADKANGAALVICPGGGYGGLAIKPEGHGIAEWLNKHGITGIVLEYRLPKGRSFVPLLDAQRAIRTTRANAKQWNLNPDHIGIIGFSAGGHLASTAETHFDAGDPNAKDPIDRVSSRPDFAILIYPVIVYGGHKGTFNNLLGKDPKPELKKLFSNDLQVTDKTPPTFLAHALDDKVVAEYLELPSGGHGLNGYKGPSWDAWQAGSLKFLAKEHFIPEKDAE